MASSQRTQTRAVDPVSGCIVKAACGGTAEVEALPNCVRVLKRKRSMPSRVIEIDLSITWRGRAEAEVTDWLGAG